MDYKTKFGELVNTIKDYESDTFSASGSKLNNSEAIIIADNLVCHAIQQLIDTDTMDGVIITEELENIRECPHEYIIDTSSRYKTCKKCRYVTKEI